MDKKKKVIILSILAVLIVLCIILAIGFFSRKTVEEEKTPEISYEKVERLYDTLMSDCKGAYVFPIKEGEPYDLKDKDIKAMCHTENYYSKLFGFTDTENGAYVDIKVLKKVNHQVYDLFDKFIGEYEESMMMTMFDYGTTYRYTYTKDQEEYRLEMVEVPSTINPPETTE